MSHSPFADLVLKVLLGEASESERADLNRLRSSDPACERLWLSLQEDHARLVEAASVSRDMAAKSPEIPPERLANLMASLPGASTPTPVSGVEPARQEKRARGPRKSWAVAPVWWWTSLGAAALVVILFVLWPGKESPRPAWPASLALYLTAPWSEARTLLPGRVLRTAGSHPLKTPVGATRWDRPTFDWVTADVDTFNFELQVEDRTVARLIGVRPPLTWESVCLGLNPASDGDLHLLRELQEDVVYSVVITPVGQPLGATRTQFWFRRSKQETRGSLPSLQAVAAELSREPPLPGEALQWMRRLPESEQQQPAALRLEAWALDLLGLTTARDGIVSRLDRENSQVRPTP
jgi:hypothetical protein